MQETKVLLAIMADVLRASKTVTEAYARLANAEGRPPFEEPGDARQDAQAAE